MIILHKGRDLYGMMHTGYIVFQEHKYFIIDLHDRRFEVEKTTISPIIDENTEHMLDNFPDIFGFSLLNALKNKGVYTIKDLIRMSDDDLLNTRGVGVVKLSRIKDLLDKYNERF